MSIIGKYDPESGQYKVDTEAGDKIARILVKGTCYASVAGGSAAVGAIVGGHVVTALGSALVATTLLHEIDKRADHAVERIKHDAPKNDDIANALSMDEMHALGEIRAAMQQSCNSAEFTPPPASSEPASFGLNIAIEEMEGMPENLCGDHALHRAHCAAKPKTYSGHSGPLSR